MQQNDSLIESFIYSIIKERKQKYGTYEQNFIFNSVLHYLKLAKVEYTNEKIHQIIKEYNVDKVVKLIELNEYKNKPIDKFILPEYSICRYAVCPNSSPTIFNLKGLAIHKLFYDRSKNIKIYLRFDDTSPRDKKNKLRIYNSYINAATWFNLSFEIIYASDRLERYYEIGKELILLKKAYLEFRNKKYYDLDSYNNFIKYKQKYTSYVLKIVDPVKDWVGLRYIANTHIRTSKYKIWPTLNFHSPIDDVDLGITNIYRGKDLKATEVFQKTIYEHLNYSVKTRVYWGRNRFENYSVHSSTIMKNKRLYDASAVIYENLLYYHISANSLLKFYEELGLSNTDTIINVGLIKKYQNSNSLPSFIKYEPAKNYLMFYTEHISNKTGYIYVDKSYKNYKIHTILKINNEYYKINPYKDLVKLLF